MEKLWTVDARMEIPGVVIELCHADWPSEVEIADANVSGVNAEHRLARFASNLLASWHVSSFAGPLPNHIRQTASPRS